MMKLDFQKTYDMVKQECLLEVLQTRSSARNGLDGQSDGYTQLKLTLYSIGSQENRLDVKGVYDNVTFITANVYHGCGWFELDHHKGSGAWPN